MQKTFLKKFESSVTACIPLVFTQWSVPVSSPIDFSPYTFSSFISQLRNKPDVGKASLTSGVTSLTLTKPPRWP